jgi:putative Mg2+ transporter-C (MgtC) family protein
MSLELQAQSAFALIWAAFLSMIIGLDRERGDQPAGVRTHMLVGVGACLFTILSAHAFPGADAARVASNIVVGIGFLGAGTIIRRSGQPHHLTTAASIWATAAVGMAVGTGAWFLALVASVLVWIILAVIRQFSKGHAIGVDYGQSSVANENRSPSGVSQ